MAVAALPTVRLLPPVVANQIAAGEVVTRPANVIKELLENSLDAGASKIHVTVQAGGTQLIAVSDDGHGMRRDDALLALRRHATSKIRSADDLSAIQTLGFRGEALPSIASVSRLTLRTRPAASDQGTELRVDGGELLGSAPCGCAPGTTVEVAELFFNVPARRKFLRAQSTESAHVTEAVLSASLAHPEVSVVLERDGRVARQWPRCSDRGRRAAQVLGQPDLRECRGARGPVAVVAHLSAPAQARSGAGGLRLFVNGRPIQDRALYRAVAAAYGPALDHGRYPVGAVFIELPAELVDVNVHPQKAEVRFAQARAVTDALHGILRAELQRQLGLPPASATVSGWNAARGASAQASDSTSSTEWQWSSPSPAEPRSGLEGMDAAIAPGGASPRSGIEAPGSRAEPLATSTAAPQFVAQLRDRFLVFDQTDGLTVIDHVTARRVLAAHHMAAQTRVGRVPAQQLLFPVVMTTQSAMVEAVEREASCLAQLGFDLRIAGPTSVALHAIAQPLGPASPEPLLVDLLDELSRLPSRLGVQRSSTIIAAVSRHAAPPGGPVAAAEALDLLRQLEQLRQTGPRGLEQVVQRLPWPAASVDEATE